MSLHERRLPQSAHIRQESSFDRVGPSDISDQFEALLSHEDTIAGGLVVATPVEVRSAYSQFAECVALMKKYPQLLFTTTFPSLYRLLRTAEITNGIKRGGEILLIGSGTTLGEACATLIEPANSTEVEEAFSNRPNFKAQSDLGRTLGPAVIPKKPGHITAVEPDSQALESTIALNHLFGFRSSQLTIVNEMLGDAFEHGFIGNKIDTVLWHRAEPKVCYGSTNGQRTAHQLENVKESFEVLCDRLVKGGSFVLTVGTGGNDNELKEREMLIGDAIAILPELSMKVIPEYSDIYFGEKFDFHKLFFGDTNYGAIGSVIAVKI